MQSAYNNITSIILPNLSPITDIIAIILKKLSIIAIKNFVPIMATLVWALLCAALNRDYDIMTIIWPLSHLNVLATLTVTLYSSTLFKL